MTISRGFPAAEFEARLENAQRRMAAAGLDLLLLTTEPDVRYFSGFLTQFWQSPTRPWFLLVPAKGKPVAVIPGIGAPAMARTWIEDIRTWSSPNPEDEGLSLLAETVRELAGETARIGLPSGPETHLRLPLAEYDRLRAMLPDATFRDDAGIVRALRIVKSEAEIAKIAAACDLVSGVFEDWFGWLAPGMSEQEIFRRFKIACLEAGADDVSYLVGGAGSGGYGDIISPPSERKVRDGDVLILDTGTLLDGYFCDFDRNYAIGAPSEAVAAAYRTVYAATEAGLAAARPGATCADLFRAMADVLSSDGAAAGNVGRIGHGLGTVLTEWPSITADDKTELVPGMVMTLEPGLEYAPGKMMVHEENIVIRADGAELLTRRAPGEIPVVR
ncbi:Xaa-Pro peptidase family protein [Nisaea acidiphila]|uniref:Xaa-Pro peptidase family protein n=1 Tax=Nisaea acidiphila TaxID=1862145 RepID=A0A9J7AW12_9PROT|nr:Xaa-Pro peptidase family protein [Nisaea acidiphila]UUX49621.1 Xaa-Pro peptidase family protein [Nisaea acidiphila]